VLDARRKADLMALSPYNIVTLDLPHLPAKTVGTDETYAWAGHLMRHWVERGVLARRTAPAMFVYRQSYQAVVAGATRAFQRRSLLCNLALREFGPAADGTGGVFPHEQTFAGAKEDRLKLMRATRAQLSPIFGLFSDPADAVGLVLQRVIDATPPALTARTAEDGVLHEAWPVEDLAGLAALERALAGKDVFIADGHHRYNTALNYRRELEAAGPLPQGHPAHSCLFVLVALQDPGMIVLPTHRVLGGMPGFTWEGFASAAAAHWRLTPFAGDLAALEAALPRAGRHAVGLTDGTHLAIAQPVRADPLAATHPTQSEAWRSLDVAIVQHLLVEAVCEAKLTPQGGKVAWKFPHTLQQLQADVAAAGYSLGVILQPTPVDAVRRVSEAGELMPQKSTFFYPKLATGLAINPLS
jgi:uncharacterized protein (DUF1015 family)